MYEWITNNLLVLQNVNVERRLRISQAFLPSKTSGKCTTGPLSAPVQPANPPPNHLACQFADPTRDIQGPKLLCCTSCSAELQNAKYSQQRAGIIFEHDRHKAASQNLTLRGTSHVRRLCRRPVRRRCRVRQVEGGVGAGGRSLEWSMGSRVWQRYRKHDHFGPDFHPLI
jgi:hypothetical protein